MNLEPTLRAAGAAPTIACAVGVWDMRWITVLGPYHEPGRPEIRALHPDDARLAAAPGGRLVQMRVGPGGQDRVIAPGLIWDIRVDRSSESSEGIAWLRVATIDLSFRTGPDGRLEIPGVTGDRPLVVPNGRVRLPAGLVSFMHSPFKPELRDLVLTSGSHVVSRCGDAYLFYANAEPNPFSDYFLTGHIVQTANTGSE